MPLDDRSAGDMTRRAALSPPPGGDVRLSPPTGDVLRRPSAATAARRFVTFSSTDRFSFTVSDRILSRLSLVCWTESLKWKKALRNIARANLVGFVAIGFIVSAFSDG